MVAQAQFSDSGLTIAPGDEAVAALTVLNLGDRTETYSLIPSGLTASWVKIVPPSITVLPGASATVTVTLSPPLQATTTAGAVAVTARAVAQSDPDDVATADLPVTVQTFDARRVHIVPPIQRGRSRARFDVVVENQGNGHASCRLHLVDPTGRVDGSFDPPSLGVEPGGNALAQVRVKAVGRQWRRSVRYLGFRVEAAQQGHDTAAADATFVQAPVIGDRFWPRVAAGAALLAAVTAAWLGVLRPAVDDAASNAVDDRIAELAAPPSVASTVAAPEQTGATPSASPQSPTNVGEPFTTRLAKDVALGSTDGSVYTVPSGFALRVSDVIVQNPAPDAGRAMLLRNSDVIFEWALANVFGNETLATVTPIEFAPGDNLTFQVTCDAFNDLTRGACTSSLILIGRLVAQ